GSAPRWSSGNQTLAARPASPSCLAEQPVSFAGPPGVILDGFDEVFVDEHGLLLRLIGVICGQVVLGAGDGNGRDDGDAERCAGPQGGVAQARGEPGLVLGDPRERSSAPIAGSARKSAARPRSRAAPRS